MRPELQSLAIENGVDVIDLRIGAKGNQDFVGRIVGVRVYHGPDQKR